MGHAVEFWTGLLAHTRKALLKGYQRAPVSNIRVTDCAFDGVESPDVLQGVQNLVLSNVRVNGRVRNETISK